MLLIQFKRRDTVLQTRSAQKEAVKSAPAPTKEEKPSGVELKWQPGQRLNATTYNAACM